MPARLLIVIALGTSLIIRMIWMRNMEAKQSWRGKHSTVRSGWLGVVILLPIGSCFRCLRCALKQASKHAIQVCVCEQTNERMCESVQSLYEQARMINDCFAFVFVQIFEWASDFVLTSSSSWGWANVVGNPMQVGRFNGPTFFKLQGASRTTTT